jgi:hypothetical protein
MYHTRWYYTAIHYTNQLQENNTCSQGGAGWVIFGQIYECTAVHAYIRIIIYGPTTTGLS